MGSWMIREGVRGEDLYPKMVYDYYHTLITMRINHGGVFTKFPGRKYINGKSTYVDLIDTDKLSVHEIDDIVVELGYKESDRMYYHFLTPGSDLDFGLEALGNDHDVLKLMKYVPKKVKFVDVFIENWKTTLDTYKSPPHARGVFIQEIDEVDVPSNALVCRRKKLVSKRCKQQLFLEWNEVLHQPVNNPSPPIYLNKVLHQPVNDPTPQIDLNDVLHQPVNDPTPQNDLNDVLHQPENDHTTPIDKGKGVSSDFDYYDQLDPLLEQDFQKLDEMGMFSGKDYGQGSRNLEENGSEDGSEGGSDDGSEDDDSNDSDYHDEDNRFEESDIDMDDFVDISEEWMGKGDNPAVDSDNEMVGSADPLDFDTFSSGDEKDNKIHDVFHLGQSFGSKTEVMKKIKDHAIETRRDIIIVKNDKTRIRAICRGEIPSFKTKAKVKGGPSGAKVKVGPNLVLRGRKPKFVKGSGSHCPWVLHTSIEDDTTWVVKTYAPKHKCHHCRDLTLATTNFLSENITEKILSNPNIPIGALQTQLQQEYEINVSLMKAMRAKTMATMKIWGDYEEQYNALRDHISELKRCNPGTTVKLDVEVEPNPSVTTRVFKRIYICLGSLKNGFKAGKRELLGLDGTFMKGPFPGQVLTAVGIDANNGIYPLAYAIVESESTISWIWFLKNLGDDLDLYVNSNFTFISDRQKGILPAIAKLFPCAEHRFCLRHIHENMKQQWKGKTYKDHLWRCATATTVPQFQTTMEELRLLNPACYEWLNQIPPQHWSRSHFKGRCHSDVLLNNMCEVFNRQLIDGRDKPIITALEYIRHYLMKRIVHVLQAIQRADGPLTPSATVIMEKAKEEASKYKVRWNGGDRYEVCAWNDQMIVYIRAKTCTCRKWELTGIPCKHAIATNWNMAVNSEDVEDPERWVDDTYHLDTWKEMYSFKIEPINGRAYWPRFNCPTKLLPPKFYKQIGRPRKKRKKAVDEVQGSSKRGKPTKLSRSGKSQNCKRCKQPGHNSRTCKGI